MPKKSFSATELFEGIRENKRFVLGKAITLIESKKPAHQLVAKELINLCLPHSGRSIRIGITGVPGVGKSTFIEALGSYVTTQGNKLAVLAVDPSSQKSGGSILGDKTRMNELSQNPAVFIRPSPSAGTLGGVAKATRETIILFEAAGYDTIFVETVGVGQSETIVHSMVDCFLLLLLAGAGDELQGIKRGIMEMADILLINKADNDNIQNAKKAAQQVKNAIHLFPANENNWIPKVELCSALENRGIDTIWDAVQSFKNHTKLNSWFDKNRNTQSIFWMHQTIKDELSERFYGNPEVSSQLKEIEAQLKNNEISSYAAAEFLLGLKQN